MTWELYDLTKDWTQFEDVAAKHPEKVKELKELFLQEAEQVPGAAAGCLRGDAARRPAPNITAGPQRVCLHEAADRHSAGRLAAAAEHVLHHHGRHRDSEGRRRRA